MTKTNFWKKNLIIIPIVYFNYAINNWSNTKVLWYLSSIILSTTIWINEVGVTVGRGYHEIFATKANALCWDRLFAAIFPSVWYHLFLNGIKSMKKTKFLQVFVHYVVQLQLQQTSSSPNLSLVRRALLSAKWMKLFKSLNSLLGIASYTMDSPISSFYQNMLVCWRQR